MRDNRKNIEYKYTDYAKHYVIGFIYKRNDAAQESKSYDYMEREKIIVPYTDVKYFIQEKYKIALPNINKEVHKISINKIMINV